MPEQVVVVAFPRAYLQGLPGTGPDGYPGDFMLVEAAPADIQMPEGAGGWLVFSPPAALSPGLSRVDYQAADNTLSVRRTSVPVRVHGKSYAVEFMQQPGELVQTQMVRVLNSPLTLDCLIAVSFIASLIQKIPIPPIKVIVVVIAVLALLALGMAAALLRRTFYRVPEPLPLSTDTNGVPITVVPGMPPVPTLPLENMLAENQTIALQTVKAVYWLMKQVE